MAKTLLFSEPVIVPAEVYYDEALQCPNCRVIFQPIPTELRRTWTSTRLVEEALDNDPETMHTIATMNEAERIKEAVAEAWKAGKGGIVLQDTDLKIIERAINNTPWLPRLRKYLLPIFNTVRAAMTTKGGEIIPDRDPPNGESEQTVTELHVVD